MTGRQVAVVDTSVIILLASDAASLAEDPPVQRRVLLAQDNMRALQKDGLSFVVPAPVIVELSRDEPGREVAARVMIAIGGLRVEAFDFAAANHAGEMCRRSMRGKVRGEEKRAIRYDALIAGIAHRLEARYLVTANPSHFKNHLDEIRSPVEVYPVDMVPRGQIQMLEILRPSND